MSPASVIIDRTRCESYFQRRSSVRASLKYRRFKVFEAMVQQQLTLYSNKASPFVQSVHIALEEAQIDYALYDIAFGPNKPKWFTEIVNPVGKVPTISYGGPQVPPDQPSPESFKLPESIVILEFLADIKPEAFLLPKDPVVRAKARFIIHKVQETLRSTFPGVLIGRCSFETFLDALKEIQALLPSENGALAVGDHFTIADAVLIPTLMRLDLALRHDIGTFAPGEGKKVHDLIMHGTEFKRLKDYFDTFSKREAVKSSWDEVRPMLSPARIKLNAIPGNRICLLSRSAAIGEAGTASISICLNNQ
ncbi:hypothetical protein HGRIS_000086 [Hohenbuehelia grisea]|uniref:GST N-terminal domain-containing protein n=1 Tax=Hohenbuehelia grisea TaxID=104357 RepID=A0ABR3JQ07_9AGAR